MKVTTGLTTFVSGVTAGDDGGGAMVVCCSH